MLYKSMVRSHLDYCNSMPREHVLERRATFIVVLSVACSVLETSADLLALNWVTVSLCLSCGLALLFSFLPYSENTVFRKSAADDAACCLLLPACLLVSRVHEADSQQLTTLFAVGSLTAALLGYYIVVAPNSFFQFGLLWLLATLLVLLLLALVGFTFVVYFTGYIFLILPIGFQYYLQQRLPRLLPRSFTVGEATVVGQGIVTFLVFAARRYIVSFQSTWMLEPLSVADQEIIFTQTAVISCALVICLLYVVPRLCSAVTYYLLVCSVAVFFSLPVLGVLLRQDFVSWLVGYIWHDKLKMLLFAYWSLWSAVLCGIVYYGAAKLQRTSPAPGSKGVDNAPLSHGDLEDTGCCIKPRHKPVSEMVETVGDDQLPATAHGDSVMAKHRASTIDRKYFHLAAIAIFVPGLVWDVNVLRVAVTCSLVVLVMLETIRILCIPPMGQAIEQSFQVFVDEQDEGKIITTHLYLLIGCSCPLWLQTDGGLSLLQFSGLLSLGVGDTAASVCGYRFGRLRWLDSRKTIEGTFAALIAQILSVVVLHITGIVMVTCWLYVILCLLLISLLEAWTSQIDNLILPLFTCILFSALNI